MSDHLPIATTVRKFCRKYDIDPSTYYRGAKAGSMPPGVKIGGATRILIEDEQTWLKAVRARGHLSGRAPVDATTQAQGGSTDA
jgi:hypothetical protein